MNNFDNGFNQYSSSGIQNSYPNLFPQNNIRTSKIFVTSLQEALSRNSMPGTHCVYYQQDGNIEYEVITDYSGKKYYEIYKREKFVQETNFDSLNSNQQVSRKEFDELKNIVNKLEEKYVSKQSEVNASNEFTSTSKE